MKVSIIVPNWNGITLLQKHLSKVLQAVGGAEVVVADDASTDGSVEYLRKNFPKVVLVERQKHEGFASNVNAGVRASTGDIVILLNTDVEPEKDFLPPLLSHFRDPGVFAVGCIEKSVEGGKVVLRGRGLAKWEKGFFIHSRGDVTGKETAWVSGGSGAFRRSVWNVLGGMDTLYNPFYWEDIDLSYRARKSGWKTLFESKSIVHHYHEEGKIKREFTPWEVKRIAYRNQFIFIWKNVTGADIIWAHAFWAPIRLLQRIFSGDFLMLEGYGMAVMKILTIVNHRIAQRRIFRIRDQDLDLRV